MLIKFFVDSCIFIESFKKEGIKEAKELYKIIFKDFENNYFINEVIIDEVFFYFINNKQKFHFISLKDFSKIFEFFEVKTFVLKVLESWIDMIEKYSLKTHDALILATCKHYDIKYLISIDTDFIKPCEKEGIILINSAEKLQKVLNIPFSL